MSAATAVQSTVVPSIHHASVQCEMSTNALSRKTSAGSADSAGLGVVVNLRAPSTPPNTVHALSS